MKHEYIKMITIGIRYLFTIYLLMFNYCRQQHHSTVFNTVQYNTVECNTILYSTSQHNTMQYTTIQYDALHYTTLQYSTIIAYCYYSQKEIVGKC